MDKYLRPSRFELEPSAPGAEKEWKHWLKTFNNFIATMERPSTTDQPAIPVTSQQKLKTLLNFISASIYEFISEEAEYDSVITTLNALYVKPNNILYNRHLLATRKQLENESVDQYLQHLEKLSKSCEFSAVTAEVYRKEYIRDSFINGLQSQDVRRRILENDNLSLDEAHQKARALELAQKHSQSYNTFGNYSNSAAIDIDADDSETSLAAGRLQNEKKKCFFCGSDYHVRSKCPARNSTCNNCSKTGHWSKVCNSSQNSGRNSARTSNRNSEQNSGTLCAVPYLA